MINPPQRQGDDATLLKGGLYSAEPAGEDRQQVTTRALAASLVTLFVPIFIARLSWIGMKTTDTALLGHTGTSYLAATSLADFWTGAFTPFISDNILASKLGPAFGAKNYDNVAIWTQVSVTLYSWVLLLVAVTFFLTHPVLLFGVRTSPEIAGYGAYFTAVMALCLPARLFCQRVGTFFVSQAITKPASYITTVSVVCNFVLGLQLVLGIPFKSGMIGFWACPAVTVFVEWISFVLYFGVYCGKLGYHKKCWGEVPSQWSYVRDVFLAPVLAKEGSERFAYYNEHIRPRMWDYVKLAVPANIAGASDFWRMSVIGFLSGMLSNNAVAVFNASYRFAWMNLVVIGSFNTAVSTKIGIALGEADAPKAKQVVRFGIVFVMIFLSLMTALTVSCITYLALLFSSDPPVLALFSECRYGMGLMIFFMCLSMHFESILMALGMSAVVAKAAVLGSWVGQVPAVILCLWLMGKHLVSIYVGVGIGYFFYFLMVVVPLLRVDWDEQVRLKQAENQKKVKADSEAPLAQPLLDEKEAD